MTTSPQPTERPIPRTYLDDPVAFGHELFSRLSGGDLPTLAALDTALVSFNQTIARLRELLPDQPEAKALLDRLSDMGADIGVDQHSVGIEFGVASEHLRRTLCDGMTGPRIPWRTP